MRIKEIEITGNMETCADINLILGANNTGKTTFIKELEYSISYCEIRPKNKWISAVTIKSENNKIKFDALYPSVSNFGTFKETQPEMTKDGKGTIFGSTEWNNEVFATIKIKADTPEEYKILPTNPQSSEWHYFRFFNRLSMAIENCDTRLQGLFTTTIEKINDPYKDIVHYLYAESKIFEKISEHIKQVFGIDIMFDKLVQGKKDIRLIPTAIAPASFTTTREEAQFWEDNSEILQHQGDGLKAYLKILYSLFNPSKDIIIIDEPEAFLHSPQRRALGKFIAENASAGKQIFIATHDSEFLRGVLTNTTIDTQIIHLKNDIKGAREYSINKIPTGSTRSQNYNELVLNSYFNKLTVLCEAEDDRMIYSYAGQKFLPTEIVDVHFIGLNGKPDVFLIFKELNKLKIIASVIADIDVLYSGECLNIQNLEARDKVLLTEVQSGLNALSAIDRTNLKHSGLTVLTDITLKGKATSAIELLKKYRVFVVSVGELEGWIDTSPIPRKLVQLVKNEIDANQNTPKKVALKAFIKDVIS